MAAIKIQVFILDFVLVVFINVDKPFNTGKIYPKKKMHLFAIIVPPFDLVCAVTCNLHSTGHWSKLHFFLVYFLSFLFVRLFIDFVFRWLVFH